MENKYKIVQADQPEKLEEVVNGWMVQGWIPAGGIVGVATVTGGAPAAYPSPKYFQAMIQNPARADVQ